MSTVVLLPIGDGFFIIITSQEMHLCRQRSCSTTAAAKQ